MIKFILIYNNEHAQAFSCHGIVLPPRGNFHICSVGDMPTFRVTTIFSKNFITGSQISLQIPEQASQKPTIFQNMYKSILSMGRLELEVKFIQKAFLLVKHSDLIHIFILNSSKTGMFFFQKVSRRGSKKFSQVGTSPSIYKPLRFHFPGFCLLFRWIALSYLGKVCYLVLKNGCLTF